MIWGTVYEVKMKSEDIEKDKSSPSEEHIKQINTVYDEIPIEEQTFTSNASKAAIWETIKDDTW